LEGRVTPLRARQSVYAARPVGAAAGLSADPAQPAASTPIAASARPATTRSLQRRSKVVETTRFLQRRSKVVETTRFLQRRSKGVETTRIRCLMVGLQLTWRDAA
jgi:hypothetical protein